MKQHRFLYLNPYLRYLMLMNVALKKDIEDAYNRDTNIINFTLGEAVPSSKNNNQNSQNSTCILDREVVEVLSKKRCSI